jgi:hypothetical protein
MHFHSLFRGERKLAQKVVVQLVDDLDGSPIEGGSGRTISFALDGASYEIDLSDRNAAQLRDALAPYVKAGRRVGGRRSTGRGTSGGASSEATAMREWARAQGMSVSARGRVSADVVAAYRAAH